MGSFKVWGEIMAITLIVVGISVTSDLRARSIRRRYGNRRCHRISAERQGLPWIPTDRYQLGWDWRGFGDSWAERPDFPGLGHDWVESTDRLDPRQPELDTWDHGELVRSNNATAESVGWATEEWDLREVWADLDPPTLEDIQWRALFRQAEKIIAAESSRVDRALASIVPGYTEARAFRDAMTVARQAGDGDEVARLLAVKIDMDQIEHPGWRQISLAEKLPVAA